eukprot:1035171-Prymnesium_polylepis.1
MAREVQACVFFFGVSSSAGPRGLCLAYRAPCGSSGRYARPVVLVARQHTSHNTHNGCCARYVSMRGLIGSRRVPST